MSSALAKWNYIDKAEGADALPPISAPAITELQQASIPYGEKERRR